MRRFLVVIAVLIATLTTLSAAPADPDQLSGYTRDNAQAERQWEQKFKAIPDPARIRDDMQRLAARPHHVGSPYDKDNSEWLLATFKQWGLDAHIETFTVLFPTPKAARRRTGGAEEIRRQAGRADHRGRSDIRPKG